MTSLFFLILIIITVFYGVLFARARSSHRKLTLMPLREHRSPLRVRLWRRWAPELNLFPSHERELALHRIPSKWQTNLSMAAIWILILVGEKQLRQVLCSALPLPPWVVYIIEFVMVVGVLYWLMWLSRGRIRRELRQQLIDAGFAICGPCGYDLRGLTEPRCPECGQPFEPRGDAP